MTEPREIERIVLTALDEDAPWGDLTGQTLIPADATATAELVARDRERPRNRQRRVEGANRAVLEDHAR